jgi:tRNA-dihydrouridine synthase
MNDILPEHNQDIFLIPQILTNDSADFIHTARKLEQLGYNEINLNLGCPSGTVVAKNRGSGFLSQRDKLDSFLDQIFAHATTKISVKTRIGKDSPDEFSELIEIFNKYPMEELIIHPRIQKDFYKNTPNWNVFTEGLAKSRNPVCYNGDLFTGADYEAFSASFPEVHTVMIGRGLISNPGLIDDITNNNKLDKKLLREFHDRIFEGYKSTLSGDKNVLYKMKELWIYLGSSFTDSAKYIKKIKKSDRLSDYEDAVSRLFCEQDVQ